MPLDILDPAGWALVLAGALAAGFIVGFAGFGTALVAAGFWFHALPAAAVPPLIALTSIAAQGVAQYAVRAAFDWRRAAPYLAGGLAGVPLGVAALANASPEALRLAVGAFLVAYTLYQFVGPSLRVPRWGGRTADGGVGVVGGFLGGFAGLSGPAPIVWLQLRGGTSDEQRAVYQLFNLVILAAASLGMLASGQMTWGVALVAAGAIPCTLLGARVGVKAYGRVSDAAFKRVVLALLLVSGLTLVAQSVAV